MSETPYSFDAERADAEDASPIRYVWITGTAHDEDTVPRKGEE